MSFMSIPTTLRGYNHGSLTQKDNGLKHNTPFRFITEELDNANSVYAFNRFEEERFVERFQCHFRLVDLYALATPAIQE